MKRGLLKILDAKYEKAQPPEGTITIKKYAEHVGSTHGKIKVFFAQLEREGLIEFVGHFGRCRERHYKLKDT